jgi:hypothetical protein
MSNIKKFTMGFVVQEFDEDGNLLNQEFIANDEETYEDDEGNIIDPMDEFYHPMNMEQPK